MWYKLLKTDETSTNKMLYEYRDGLHNIPSSWVGIPGGEIPSSVFVPIPELRPVEELTDEDFSKLTDFLYPVESRRDKWIAILKFSDALRAKPRETEFEKAWEKYLSEDDINVGDSKHVAQHFYEAGQRSRGRE